MKMENTRELKVNYQGGSIVLNRSKAGEDCLSPCSRQLFYLVIYEFTDHLIAKAR